MCILFFEGKGYSAEFCENMNLIIKNLSNVKIVLTDAADCICESCPNNVNSICTSSEKVKKYDDRVLKLCSLTVEKEYTFDYLNNSVKENILNKNKLPVVCSDCEWYQICSKKQ